MDNVQLRPIAVHEDPAAPVEARGIPVHRDLCAALAAAAADRARELLAALPPQARAWADARLGGAYRRDREALAGATLDAADRAAVRSLIRARAAERICGTALRDAGTDGRVRGWLRGRQPSGRWLAAGEWHALPRPRSPAPEVDRLARALLDGRPLPADVDPADLVRTAVLAPAPGRVLIAADWAQVQPRILWTLGSEPWPSGDPYAALAVEVGVPRDVAKRLVLGGLYGLGVPGLRRLLPDLGEDAARDLLDRWEAAIPPGVRHLRDHVWTAAGASGAITLPSGRRVTWADGAGPRHAGATLSWLAQGTEADLLDTAVLETERRGAGAVFTLHDGLWLECDATEAAATEALAREVLTTAPAWLPGLPLEVAVSRVDALPIASRAPPRPVPLAEAGAAIERVVRGWLADPADAVLVVRSPGGAAKSRAARAVLRGHVGGRVVYCARTHALLDVVEAETGAWRWCGPGASLPGEAGGRVPVCARAVEIEAAGSPTWWSAAVCPACLEADGCRARERPPRDAPVVACTHAGASSAGVRAALAATAWLLDEDPPATRTATVGAAGLAADPARDWRTLAAGLRIAARAALEDGDPGRARVAARLARARGDRTEARRIRDAARRARRRAADLTLRAGALDATAGALGPAAAALRAALAAAETAAARAAEAAAASGAREPYETSWAGERLRDLLDDAALGALEALGECSIPLPAAGDVSTGSWLPPETAEVVGALVRSARGVPRDGECAAVVCPRGGPTVASATFRVDLPPGPVLVLDGTADVATMRARGGGRPVRVVDLEVAPADPGAVLRLRRESGSWSRSECRRRGWAESARLAVRLIGLAAEASREHLGRSPARVGVLTHRPLAVALARRPEAAGWVVGYYGADDRGSNRYEDVDLLVVLGDPYPHLGDSARQAAALGVDAAGYLAVSAAATVEQAVWRARSLRRRDRHAVLVAGRVDPPGWRGLPVGDLADPRDPTPAVAPLVEALEACILMCGMAFWPETEFAGVPIKRQGQGMMMMYTGTPANSAERDRRSQARAALRAAGYRERPIPRDLRPPGRRGRPSTFWTEAWLPADWADAALRDLLATADAADHYEGGPITWPEPYPTPAKRPYTAPALRRLAAV